MNALATALAEPWMIERSALDSIAAIAARDDLADRIEAVAARAGRPMENARKATHRDGVATIPLRGPIIRHATMFSDICGAASVEQVAADLRVAMDSPGVRAIVLECDSPGGQVTGIAELAEMIREHAATKPIVAYVDGGACSAAYYLACACSEIVVAPMGRVGSIGALMGIPPKDNRPGAAREFVSSQSPMKNPDPTSEAGSAAYQDAVDQIAAVFVADVAKYRAVSVETVLADFGRGGTMIGHAAVAAGMADRVGTFEALHRDLASGRPRPGPTTNHTRAADPTAANEESPTMWKQIWARFGSNGQPETLSETRPAEAADETPAVLKVESIDLAENPVVKALMSQVADLTAKLADKAPAADLIAQAAASFADAMVAGEMALPAERAALIDDYSVAAQDDASHPVQAGPSRVDRLKSRVEARPRHGLTAERIGVDQLPPDAQILPHAGAAAKAEDPTPEGKPVAGNRLDFLLSQTPEGRAVLASRTK